MLSLECAFDAQEENRVSLLLSGLMWLRNQFENLMS